MPENLSLQKLLNILADEFGIDLRGYKHSTLQRRLERRMTQVGASDYEHYLNYLRTNSDEKSDLLATVLINVTEFFRDPQAWEVVAQDVLPLLLAGKRAGDTFRAWVAGCASGEEAYSLAILLAEQLGHDFHQYDIKIYATDVDEEALHVARRGEYSLERLRLIRPEWKTKYFHGQKPMRISRDIRKMVIFGRSDLIHDAPISHVELLICRNVLIYFDALTQKHIFSRLHYALEEGGVLFLGKAESKLTESTFFTPINSRWRIFRRNGGANLEMRLQRFEDKMIESDSKEKQELSLLRLYHKNVLEVLEPGIIMMDSADKVLQENESSSALWGIPLGTLLNKNIRDTIVARKCPELLSRIHESHQSESRLRFQCRLEQDGVKRTLEITLRPVTGENRARVGTLLYVEDVSVREKLQHTVEKLEATSEELQSVNEELETTNEELQSTNEELETTNEELQSLNEELETTNEELQSLNEELENMNEELEFRTRELDALNSRYTNTLEQMPWAVALVEETGRIQFWNSAAEKLFKLSASAMIGLDLGQLPIQENIRQALQRRFRLVLEKAKPVVLKEQQLYVGRTIHVLQIHFTLIEREGALRSVLIMFGPFQPQFLSGKKDSRPLSSSQPKLLGKPASADSGDSNNTAPRKTNNRTAKNERPHREKRTKL